MKEFTHGKHQIKIKIFFFFFFLELLGLNSAAFFLIKKNTCVWFVQAQKMKMNERTQDIKQKPPPKKKKKKFNKHQTVPKKKKKTTMK